MKKFFTLLIALVFIGSISFAQNPEVLNGVLKIKFKAEKTKQLDILVEKTSSKREITANTKAGYVQTGIASIDKLNQKYGAVKYTRIYRDAGINEAKHRKYGLHLWYKVEYNTKATPIELAKEFMNSADIEHANPEYIRHLSSVPNSKSLTNPPNDPKFADQWHYENTGQNSGTVGADISLLDAWTLETGNSNVIVAVEDQGVDFDHPDLAGNMWINTGEIAGNGYDDDNNGFVDDIYGYNFGDGQGTITPDDHGTHVAGTIAAETNNGIGVAGIAGGTGNNDGVRIMSCEVFGTSSQGGFDEAFVYAADMGAHVSQNSWGGGGEDQSVNDAIDYFIANGGSAGSPMQGGVVIIAAGNSSTNTGVSTWPAQYAPAIAVAATNKNDKLSYYSNYGTWVDISAPGGELESSNYDPTAIHSTYNNGAYGVMQGTSMACPHVSGVAALIISRFAGNITPAEVRSRLIDNTDNIEALNSSYNGQMGSGRLNAFASLGGSVVVDTEAPTTPTGLASSNVTENSVVLNWNAATDNIGVTGYDIYRNGSYLSTTANTTSTITGLSSSTTYSFYVKAKDAAGNESGASTTINITTDEYVAQYCESKGNDFSYEWIAGIEIGSYTKSSGASGYSDFTSENITLEAGSAVSVSLTPGFASSTYNEYWKIWIDYNNDKTFADDELAFDAGALSKTAVTGTMNILSSATGTTRMRVSMKYNAAQTACETFSYGEVEDYTVTFGNAGPDTQAPTAPTGLSSSDLTKTTFTLNWNASSDNIGVTGYDVYSNGSLLGSVTGTSANITGLTASTSYAMTVKAKDAAGNVSASSNSLSVTTLNDQITYCSSKGNNSSYEWIDLVRLNQIDNTTGNDGGYKDYTSMTANVALGSSQTIYISCGFKSSSYTEYWHVWIDFDQNGTFDSDELMVSGSSSSAATLSGTFTVPSDALLGATRMRVTMKYNAAATACETFSYGEVEDYTINVVNTSSFAYTYSSALELGNENPTEIVIYPNPASSYINVSVKNGSKSGIINIYNSIGTLIKVVEIEGDEREINISELPAGLYIISIDDEKEPLTKQFIIK